MKRFLMLASVAGLALVMTACGSALYGGQPNSTPTAGGGGAKASPTVMTRQVGGVGTVLVDSSGLALYTNDQDGNGVVKCNGDCAKAWLPLTVKSAPTAADGVTGLGTVTRSDGSLQVTLNGRPLYTFYLDHPGKVTGNGVADAFGSQHFTWHVALASGATNGSGGAGGSGNGSGGSGNGSGGSGGGGYGY